MLDSRKVLVDCGWKGRGLSVKDTLNHPRETSVGKMVYVCFRQVQEAGTPQP